jgi:PAS domain-containing protein
VEARGKATPAGEFRLGDCATCAAKSGRKQKLEAGLREQNHEVQKQLETMSRAYRDVKEQLEQLKLAREQFVHQRSELVRSKDVLELHVRARTQQLEKLQREYALILNSAGEGICGFDIGGKVTFANPAAAKIMGCRSGRHARRSFPVVQPSITASNGHHNPVECWPPGSTAASLWRNSFALNS